MVSNFGSVFKKHTKKLEDVQRRDTKLWDEHKTLRYTK